MSRIWFTSDLHLNHNREFIWGPRGFNSVYEMNNTIIENWNNMVSMEDDIYVLGDLMLGNNETGIKMIKELKGNLHIIRGNHDSDSRMKLYETCYNVVEICEGKFLKAGGSCLYLTHFPCITANFDDAKALKVRIINLCGHSHYKNRFQDMDKGLIYHVELDAHDNKLISVEDIIEDIKNYIEQKKGIK